MPPPVPTVRSLYLEMLGWDLKRATKGGGALVRTSNGAGVSVYENAIGRAVTAELNIATITTYSMANLGC